MAPPSIYGEPSIEQTGKDVLLKVTVKASAVPKFKWSFKDKPIQQGDIYKFASKDEGGGRVTLSCAIANFDKPLEGLYKVDFSNDEGGTSATFTLQAGNAPEFTDKPHIAKRDGGNVIVIKARCKSAIDCTGEWLKDGKPLKTTDRIKSVVKKDDKDAQAYQFALEIHGPQKSDQAKYTIVLKNDEGKNEQSLNLSFEGLSVVIYGKEFTRDVASNTHVRF